MTINTNKLALDPKSVITDGVITDFTLDINNGGLNDNGKAKDANNLGLSAVLQEDGKLVVVGFSANGNSNDFALVRYNVDGSLDHTITHNSKNQR